MFDSRKEDNINNDLGRTGVPEGTGLNAEVYQFSSRSQVIYSDAHFVPADDSTTPAKFYVPPRKSQPKKNRHRKGSRAASGRIALTAALCLAFSAVGGVIGAALVFQKDSTRLDAMEAKLAMMETPAYSSDQIISNTRDTSFIQRETAASGLSGVPVSPSQIYDTACTQVVGITTEVTYSNFFGRTSSSAVSGTGFIVSDDGYVVTNHHVIEYAYRYGYAVSVILHDGASYEAEIIGTDPDNDIAVLKINETGLTPVLYGDSDFIHVGDTAYAVGNPLGELEFTMTSGTVTALNRLIASDTTEIPVNMFQIDAAVNTGNSGGPVYNARGEVIGVVTAKYSSGGVEGIGFAIPVNDARRIAQDIIANGYVTGKAYLGVYYDESSNSIYNRYYRDLWNAPEGVLVLRVEPGSSAEKAGVYEYDTIVSIDDIPVSSCSDLLTVLRNHSAGDSITVTVFRAGEGLSGGVFLNISVVLDEAVPGNDNGNMSKA